MKLTLQAFNNNWERFSSRKDNKLFKSIREKILKRDKYTCQYCRYRTPYLEVINCDSDYNNNTMKNLVAACELCAKCTLLDFYSIGYEGTDKIIYLPDITQEQLNHLCRIVFCKITLEGDVAYNAQMILSQLQNRAVWLDEKTKANLSQPALFVHYKSLKDSDMKLISQLRWLPSQESFAEYIPKWKEQFVFEDEETEEE